jgi:hypothetical protein
MWIQRLRNILPISMPAEKKTELQLIKEALKPSGAAATGKALAPVVKARRSKPSTA